MAYYLRKFDINTVSPSLLIALVGAISAMFHALVVLHPSTWYFSYNDIMPMFQRAAAPGISYFEKSMEYPVLIGFFIQGAQALGKTFGGFYLVHVGFLVACAVVATSILKRLTTRWALLQYWVFAPSMVVFLVYNWDAIALLVVIAALYFVQHHKHYHSAAFLALGFSTKFFPILYLIPLVFMQTPKNKMIKVCIVFFGVVLLMNGWLMLLNFDGWVYFFTFNGARDPNPDSIWGITQWTFPSIETSVINFISWALFIVGYMALLRKLRNKNPIAVWYGTTLLFLFFNKIVSPQYILWLLPFFALMPIRTGIFYALELSNLAVFFSLTSWFFLRANASVDLMALFVIVRHALLFLLLARVWRNA